MSMDGLVIDSFAGGGGALLGIAWATGKAPDIALNHDPIALAMHAKNHPDTVHVCEDAYRTNLRKVTKGRRVAWLWASPDCTDFSRAKGNKPVRKHVRSLAWMVIKWAEQIKPAGIILENVREFEEWGPLVPKWKCRACEWAGTEGQTVLCRRNKKRRRCPRCESLKLTETEDMLRDPKRKGLTFKRWAGRLRNLGYELQWRVLDAADYGAPTNRKRLFLIARRDGQPIVWPEPTHCNPAKLGNTPLFAPLKPWRPAADCIDWSLPIRSIFEPGRNLVEKTMWRIAQGTKRFVLDNPRPFLVPMTHSGERRFRSIDEPLPTITTAHRGEYAIAIPSLVHIGNGERKGQAARVMDINDPLNTIVAGGSKQYLVAAFIAKHFGGVVGSSVEQPLPTTTTRGTQNQLVTAHLVHFNHGDKQWSGLDEPMRTVTTGRHAALVYAFLVKYFGTAIGEHITDPLPTVTTKDRFGLVTVTIDQSLYVLYDICMRMLSPRELARGQGFPDTYILHPKSKTKQIELIGNSVSPYASCALFGANCGAMVTV